MGEIKLVNSLVTIIDYQREIIDEMFVTLAKKCTGEELSSMYDLWAKMREVAYEKENLLR